MPKAVCEMRACGWRGYFSQQLTAPDPFNEGQTLYACPGCRVIGTTIRACDHDGCWRPVTCGTPTPTGYASTCYDHQPSKPDDVIDGLMNVQEVATMLGVCERTIQRWFARPAPPAWQWLRGRTGRRPARHVAPVEIARWLARHRAVWAWNRKLSSDTYMRCERLASQGDTP